MSWVVAAFASAFFAGITSILAKCGIKQTDSDIATAIRTCVVLVFAWQWRAFLDPLGPLAVSNQILALSRPLRTRYRCFVDLLL